MKRQNVREAAEELVLCCYLGAMVMGLFDALQDVMRIRRWHADRDRAEAHRRRHENAEAAEPLAADLGERLRTAERQQRCRHDLRPCADGRS